MVKEDCPCKKKNCKRHGDCDACRAYHAKSKRKRPCEREKNNIGVLHEYLSHGL